MWKFVIPNATKEGKALNSFISTGAYLRNVGGASSLGQGSRGVVVCLSQSGQHTCRQEGRSDVFHGMLHGSSKHPHDPTQEDRQRQICSSERFYTQENRHRQTSSVERFYTQENRNRQNLISSVERFNKQEDRDRQICSSETFYTQENRQRQNLICVVERFYTQENRNRQNLTSSVERFNKQEDRDRQTSSVESFYSQIDMQCTKILYTGG